MEKVLDIRDISIVDAFPVYGLVKQVLNVGCGRGRIDYYLANEQYRVFATDINKYDTWENQKNLSFHTANIFDVESFPVSSSSVVICAEVLEHLKEYKEALKNLLFLARTRLIITVPFEKSFNNTSPPPEGHCNYWSDEDNGSFKDINEFKALCSPYSVSISKIRTKPRDVQMGQWGFLIVVDKRQRYG